MKKRHSSRQGQILLLWLFSLTGFMMISFHVLRLSWLFYMEEKLQTTADAALLSSVRITAKSLESIAERWVNIGQHLGPVLIHKEVSAPEERWATIVREADTLRSAISGYRSRTAAVVTVVAEANGLQRSHIELAGSPADRLPIVSESLFVRDPSGNIREIRDAWYRRSWTIDPLTRQPFDRRTLRAEFPVVWFGKEQLFQRESNARLVWLGENESGGFPATWDEAVRGGRLDPYSDARFSAELASEPESL